MKIKFDFWKNMELQPSGTKNMLVSCLPYSLTLKMEVICSF
jgi:hypothetical protein